VVDVLLNDGDGGVASEEVEDRRQFEKNSLSSTDELRRHAVVCVTDHRQPAHQMMDSDVGVKKIFNPLMNTLKPQSTGPLYSNAVIGTLAVDRWAVTFGTAMRGLGGLRPRPLTNGQCTNFKVSCAH